jgi:hypothetical protein
VAIKSDSRFDLRTTIPLATRTLISLARRPRRSWILPALTLLVTIAFAMLLLELMFYPGPVTALAYEGDLRSQLIADYGSDPISSRVQGLRLSIVDELLGNQGDNQPAQERALDPVPTVTPEATRAATETRVPTEVASEPPSETPTDEPTPTPSETPLPVPSATGAVELDCGKLFIDSFWIHSNDELRARVRNELPERAYLTYTVFEWPDVPPPAHVDWFRFDDDRYFTSPDDYSSPTSATSWERIRRFSTELWRVDFDGQPDVGIYGAFGLLLEFEVPALGGSCSLRAETSRPIPPTEVPSATPSETSTDLPPSATPLPSATPVATDTPAATATPVATETPTLTPTPDSTAIPALSETAEPTVEPVIEPTES